ncbi:MAG: N,N-dimethylformamidase beta subunit family domain-containing protein [Oryzihumus sp.]
MATRRRLLTAALLVGALGAGCASAAAPAGQRVTGRPPDGTVGTSQDIAAPARPWGSDPVALERGRPGTSAWRLTRPATAGQIEGYLLAASAPAGATPTLRVSTSAPRFRVQAFRFGWYVGGSARLVWRSGWLTGRKQPAAAFAPYPTRTVTAPWRDSVRVPTRGWPPGAYLLKLTASTGWQSHVPYVVRSTTVTGRVVLVAPVATWQAYNTWGGYSLYAGRNGDRRAWRVSFDRPYADPGTTDMVYGVLPVVERAERLGIPLAYLTDLDVDARPDALAGARAFVTLGHAEYWTPAMRERVLAARAAGTNLAFLGANTEYWRIRLASTGTGRRRAVVSYKSDAASDPVRAREPALTTARFRDPPAAVPEEALTGVRYECFPVDAGYRVVSPGWWGFAGTGVVRGSTFAHLVGVEADRVYPVPGLPRPMEVLSDSPYSCGGVPTAAESAYFTVGSGAGVFTAGTLRWTCALVRRCGPVTISPGTARFVRRVLDNVLRAFAIGPAGRRHPAHDNLARLRLPTAHRVPTS